MKQNIFLVTIDALRADYIYEHNGDVHPFISRLKEDSLAFKKAYAPGCGTKFSFKGMFSDFSPLESGSGSDIGANIPEEANFISEIFKREGYHTAGFSSNAHLTRVQDYNRGFDYFYDGLDEGSKGIERSKSMIRSKADKFLNKIKETLKVRPENIPNYLVGKYLASFQELGFTPAPTIINKIKNYINNYEKEKPLFLWAHFMEVHSPYSLPSYTFSKINEKKIPLWKRHWLRQQRHTDARLSNTTLNKKDMKKIKTLYKCGIRYIDDQISQLFDYLKKNGYLDEDLFVVTSDHGENLGENDLLTHSGMYNSVLHIPLIVYNSEKQKETNKVFSTSNLIPLLIDLTSKKSTKSSILDNYPDYAISERRYQNSKIFTIQNKKYKIFRNIDEKKERVYKLEDEKETKLVDRKDEEILELKEILRDHIQKVLTSKQTPKKEEEKEKINRVVSQINAFSEK